MSRERHFTTNSRGFSLIELVMVISILGIVSVIGYSKLFGRSALQEKGFFEEVLQASRYAQKQAMAWGCDVQIQYTASTYTLTRRASSCTAGGFTGLVGHPIKSGSYTGTAPNGVSLSPAATLHFDRVGRPRNTAGTLLSSNTNISVGSFSLRIVPETGYVYEP